MTEKTELSRFKQQATRLRSFLQEGGTPIKQTHALEAVATMHGYPNYNTLKHFAETSGVPVPGEKHAHLATLRDALDRALSAPIKGIDDLSSTQGALRIHGELIAMDCDLSAVEDPRNAIMLAAVMTASPDVVFAQLEAIALMAPASSSLSLYAVNASWFERLLGRCVAVDGAFTGIDHRREAKAAELRRDLRIDFTAYAASYGLALAALAHEDYTAMAQYLERANRSRPVYQEDDWMSHTDDLTINAALVWLLQGNYARALALCSTGGSIGENGDDDDDEFNATAVEIVKAVSAISQGYPAGELADAYLAGDGLASQAMAEARVAVDRDVFVLIVGRAPFRDPVETIDVVVEVDIAILLGRIAAKDAKVAAWIAGVAGGERQPGQLH